MSNFFRRHFAQTESFVDWLMIVLFMCHPHSTYHHIQTSQRFPHHKLNIGNALGSVGSNVPDGRSHRVHELLQNRYRYQRLKKDIHLFAL